MPSRLHLLFLCLSTSCWLCAGACFAGTEQKASQYKQGLKFYQAANYLEAARLLKKVTEADPGDASAHYYLANSLAYLHFKEEAAREYEACLQLNPSPQYSRYCRLALDKLKHNNVSSSGTTGGDAHPTIRTPHSLDNDVHQAESLIEREAQFEKQKNSAIGDTLARNASVTADSLGKRIQDQAERDAQDVLRPPGHGLWDPARAAARADQIRRDAAEMANEARAAADRAASQFRDWSKQRQQAIDEVVENLQKQLEAPDDHRGVKPLPEGTDLYVRFYGYGRSSYALPDVHPATVRIIDPGNDYASKPEVGQSAKEQELDAAQQPHVTRSVRGSVLNKYD